MSMWLKSTALRVLVTVSTALFSLPTDAKPLTFRPGRDMDVLMAETRLGTRPYMAIEQARACLANKPDKQACRSILFEGLVRVRKCDDIAPLVDILRQTRLWDHEHAVTEGICHLRRGDLAAAEAAFLEAIHISGRTALPWYEIGVVRILQQDWDGAAEALGEVALAKRNTGPLAAFSAWYALESGDADVDAAVEEGLARIGGRLEYAPALAQLHVVACRRWLDLGDPVAAVQSAEASRRVNFRDDRNVACLVEAQRRMGEFAMVEEVLGRSWYNDRPTAILHGVRARVATDRKRYAEAQRWIDLMWMDETDRLATQWYLARARGDGRAMASLADEWSSKNAALDRTLEQLIPVEQ
ncbi:MAG: hypothetical protein ACON4N_08155 [Myxococcota bacterium]